MGPLEIPPAVRRFIAEHVDSVSLLDVLLLVRAEPDKAWTAGEVGRALAHKPSAAGALLRSLEQSGLATDAGPGYRYAPGDLEPVLDELAECYATRRPTIVALIFARPDDAVTEPADAFRLRRRRD